LRLSLNWLQDYVSIDMSPEELGNLLTMAGLEVDGIEPYGQGLDDVIVAEVLSVRDHPAADRLFVCDVNTGSEKIPVVCGAPNLTIGAKVPLALPGIELPGGMRVEADTIRGERSAGMLLAEDEMELSDDHTGIMILDPDLTPGETLPGAVSMEDWALEVSITPNRPDWTSVLGVAREIAALTGQSLSRPVIEIEEEDTPAEDLADVTIEDPEGCPRYAASVIRGITLGPSPFWLRSRLHKSGVRSINNVVDVTNYVMLEMGQPLHAFDYDRLRENRIVVRRSIKGETFTTLDGQSHQLNDEVLMICDGQRPVAIAGVMGGLNSEIFAGSVNVLLESACFDPRTIRRGSKWLGLSTEASYRFERGTDVEGVVPALRRASGLISHLTGGRIAGGVIDRYPSPQPTPLIELRVNRTNQFLGTSISQPDMAGYLRALEMETEALDQNRLRVRPPSFRVDVSREVDLMEEVARLEGYDRIPVTLPAIRPSEEEPDPEFVLRDHVRKIMVGLGFSEVISYSFVSSGFPDLVAAPKESPLRSFVELLKPLTTDQSVMRTSLVPGLMAAVKDNAAHAETDLRLFEWGKVFIDRDDDELPLEKTVLAACMTGSYQHKVWHGDRDPVDFYHIKGAVESLLEYLAISESVFQRDGLASGYHSAASCHIIHAGSRIGIIGRIAPQILEGYELQGLEVYLFELDIEGLLKAAPQERRFRPFARFPAVYRDVSLIVERSREIHQIQEIVRRVGGDLVESVSLFDLYEGEKIGSAKKALAFRICYRSQDRTLAGKEINQLHEAIIAQIRQETGGRLREG
jgi:phenylalanyl-tRNA synthetase beta chain